MVIDSVKYGMKLWALQLIPALFPFMILTGMFLWFNDKYGKDIQNTSSGGILSKVWHLSPNGIYILLLAHICGYPSGAKMIHDRYQNQKISREEANYLLSISNQSSPAFIHSYLIVYAMNQEDKMLELFLLLYVSTFLTSLFTRKIYYPHKKTSNSSLNIHISSPKTSNTLSNIQILSQKNSNTITNILSPFKNDTKPHANYIQTKAKKIRNYTDIPQTTSINTPFRNYTIPSQKSPVTQEKKFFDALDDSITSAAATCIKIGGYIILFSALSPIVLKLFSPIAPYNQLITSTLEITCGLSILRSYPVTDFLKQLLLLANFSFGGLCTMAQIKGMLVGTPLSILPYLVGKCIYTILVLVLYVLLF